MKKWLGISVVIGIVVIALIFFFGVYSRSKVVPPGTTVLVIKPNGKTTVHNQGAFYAWGRDRVYFVDRKLKTYPENMQILCADKINMDVDVKWLGSFSIDDESMEVIKQKVPSVESKIEGIKAFNLSLDQFYADAIRPIVRQKSRVIISPYSTDVISENREKIQQDIRDAVITRLKELKYPVETSDVVVSNLDFPEEVTAQRGLIKKAQLDDERLAAEADARVEQAKRAAALAREQGKAEIEAAKAVAEVNRTIGETYQKYPELLVIKQWETLQKLSETGKGTVVIVPYQALDSTVDATMIKSLLQHDQQ